MSDREWKPNRHERRVLLVLLALPADLGVYQIGMIEIGWAAGMGTGSSYPAMARLEQRGLVQRGKKPNPVTGHQRMMYSLTPDGRLVALAALGLSREVSLTP